MYKSHFPTNFQKSLALVALAGMLVSACEKKEIAHEDIVKEDLLVIIDSLGSPCEEVINYELPEELVYVVNCKTGHEYEISVSPQGRVDLQHNKQ